MAAITVEQVVAEAPELKAYSLTTEGSAFITARVALAEKRVEPTTWDDLYEYGLALLAAHLTLTARPELGGMVAGGGVLQSQSVGSASESYVSLGSALPLGPNSSTRPGMLYDTTLASLTPGMLYE